MQAKCQFCHFYLFNNLIESFPTPTNSPINLGIFHNVHNPQAPFRSSTSPPNILYLPFTNIVFMLREDLKCCCLEMLKKRLTDDMLGRESIISLEKNFKIWPNPLKINSCSLQFKSI